MKNTLKLNHEKGQIVMDRTFAKKAENTMSAEYAHLQSVRRDYPNYTVIRREIKKNPDKECWKGLTYAYMKNYIIGHEGDDTRDLVLNEFAEKCLIAECHSKCHRYPVIKKWFLAKYPEIAEFGMSTPAAEEETASKEDVTNNEEATNNDEASAPQSNKVVKLTQNNSELPMAACQ